LSLIQWIKDSSQSFFTPSFYQIYHTFICSYQKVYLVCELVACFFLSVFKQQWVRDEKNLKKAFQEVLALLLKLERDRSEIRARYYFAEFALLAGKRETAKTLLKNALEINEEFTLAKQLLTQCEDLKTNFKIIPFLATREMEPWWLLAGIHLRDELKAVQVYDLVVSFSYHRWRIGDQVHSYFSLFSVNPMQKEDKEITCRNYEARDQLLTILKLYDVPIRYFFGSYHTYKNDEKHNTVLPNFFGTTHPSLPWNIIRQNIFGFFKPTEEKPLPLVNKTWHDVYYFPRQ
jgi:hypothetical protein